MEPPADRSLLERMRRDWNCRAREDAERFVYTRDADGDVPDFDASGLANYNQLIRPFIPILFEGRPAGQCRAVEIGCGPGRMTRWLAREFQEVWAIDVSDRMLDFARARLAGCSNVTWLLGSGCDLAGVPDGLFDLVFSYIVFQHVPSRAVIASYVREAARVLKPGGAFKFQVNGAPAAAGADRQPDTWLGETVSFDEARRMLDGAGFTLLANEGAGTQYCILTARKGGTVESEGARSYILPGESWASSQLMEGWGAPVDSSWRPVDRLSRARLRVPAGEELRFFAACYLWPAGFRPVFVRALLNEVPLGDVVLSTPGDHFLEFPVPQTLRCPEVVASVLVSPGGRPPAARSMGIYVPR